MHIQVVTFQLDGIDEVGYRSQVDQIAPTFAGLPGLRSKVWIADRLTNTYGGVYIWQDQAATEAYLDGEVFRGLRTNPNLTTVVSQDFAVLAEPTRITRGTRGAVADDEGSAEGRR